MGVEKLDEQHKKLVEMLNRLIGNAAITTHSETISDLLTEMTAYAETHFETEEQLLAAHHYPQLAEHHLQHRAFRKRTVEFCTATMNGESSVPRALLAYLREWLLHHILVQDKKYTDFFREKGVT